MMKFTSLMRAQHSLLAAVMLLALPLTLGSAGLVSAAVVPITPANVARIDQPLSAGQIAVYVTRGNTSSAPETSTARYAFVPGPGAPPSGIGSLRMSSGSGTGSGNGGKTWVATPDLNGQGLAAITLSYSTYIANNNGGVTAPSLNLFIDLDGDNARDTTLVFEPYFQGSNPTTNVWQTWNAAAGVWWDTLGLIAPRGGSYPCNRTLAQIVAGTEPSGCIDYPAYPNARAVAWLGLPSLHVVTGDSAGTPPGWPNFDGYLDALNTGVNFYNFEPPSTVYVDAAWAGTPALTSTGLAAIGTPFGTAPFESTCAGLTPHFFGLDGFASQADVTAALGAGYTGIVQDCTSVVPTPDPASAAPVNAATAPLCSLIGGGTNSVVRASVPDNTVTRGSVFCQVITENSQYVRSASEIGVLSIIQQGPIQAVEVFGLRHSGDSAPDFNNPITICLAGSGQFIYLSALQAPRSPTALAALGSSGYTCASIQDAGTVVLVP
ncbi:MAG TPA: hypothetical protein VER79_11800 [Candidatus Limnocylindrales bacterium]|nr:hypothetical protein [Candidatus Limnocylindrales bacterium]